MSGNVLNEAVARGYDATSSDMFAPEVLGPTVDFLAEAAGIGPALEFAIGTGRVALPLSQRGLAVSGIDISPAMVAQLRAKPGAEAIETVIGDIASTRLPGAFSLVYLVYNTITNLLEQDQQVACFRNAAAHLAPGGRFVIEVFVPGLQRLPPGQTAVPFTVTRDYLGIDTYDTARQRLTSHHYWVRDGAGATFQSEHRYAWPAELDLMAQLAGLTLRERWADWGRQPFTGESRKHISVWEKPPG
jgi:SAM-dependent methyltransferase